MSYTYYVLENDLRKHARPISCINEDQGYPSEELARRAAADYHNYGDGPETSWPLTFVILDGRREMGRHRVGMEMEPSFDIL